MDDDSDTPDGLAESLWTCQVRLNCFDRRGCEQVVREWFAVVHEAEVAALARQVPRQQAAQVPGGSGN